MSLDEGMHTQRMVLRETLRLAVPIEIAGLRGADEETLRAAADRVRADPGLQHADDMLYRGTHCAAGFTAWARALAVMALTAWGGITFDGLHWCTTPGCREVDDQHPQPWPWSPRVPEPRRPVIDVPLPDQPTA